VRVGLFGGTFDPPHTGHLIAAQDACESLQLDRVIFIPAGSPPHKRAHTLTAPALRLEMVKAAVHGDARFEVDDREMRRSGPSYTVDTIRELHAERADDELFLLVGADQYGEFDTWRAVPEIRSLCRVAVLEREGADRVSEEDLRVPVTRIDISASTLRRRVETGASIRYLVPAAVEAVIRTAGLYAEPAVAVPADRTDRDPAG
jgi:nicotinate-nucleotide adenylyltransferase